MKNSNSIPAKPVHLYSGVFFALVNFAKGPVVLGQVLKIGWKAEEG